MTLRIKEVAKQKGIYMKDIATTLGISDGGLSQQLNGNPTIETLQKIADALSVHISELFTNDSVIGFVKVNDKIHEINSVNDLKKLIEDIETEK